MTADTVISTRDVAVEFSSAARGTFRAVDGVSLDIARGETLGLVGESGSGKSTTGRAILRLLPLAEGSVTLRGEDITDLKGAALRRRRRHMQLVHQNPYSSLNARMTIGRLLAEPLRVHETVPSSQIEERTAELLSQVGLKPEFRHRYPHEFSGGQRQRIVIARALATNPDFVVCDEPVSALDVRIQAQIIDLLESLQDRLGLTYLFIAHDLAVVKQIADRVAVMYAGRIVELATSDQLYGDPRHPYTQLLLDSVPIPDPSRQRERMRRDLPPSSRVVEGAVDGDEARLIEVAPGHWVAPGPWLT